jgi:hypothetical protein
MVTAETRRRSDLKTPGLASASLRLGVRLGFYSCGRMRMVPLKDVSSTVALPVL